jgi:serine/threonine protein kinase
MIIAGRFQVDEFLGEAAFSTAIQCKDLASAEGDKEPESVCLKIIKNNKDYFDQSLDEIKLLHFINSRGDPEKFHVLRMIDYFYYKEHLFLVTELLKDNLYEYSRYIRHSGAEPYFTLPRLKSIMRQLLEAVAYVHSLHLIHCDIKPENILIQSYSQVKVKLIDFGSSCFTTDYLNSYVQSRSYRAPEVILGLPYGPKIDVWSLGTVAAELLTGNVLFQNQSVPTMLIRMTSILGPVPVNMLLLGTAVNKYFLSGKMVFERTGAKGTVTIMRAKKTSIKHRLHSDDAEFVDFVTQMLQYDQTKRPTALEALRHPFVCEKAPDVEEDSAEAFETELRGASAARGVAASGGGGGSSANTPKRGGPASETGRFGAKTTALASAAKKEPPQRLKSTKGKVVGKPEKPRSNNAFKKTRMKPGASF